MLSDWPRSRILDSDRATKSKYSQRSKLSNFLPIFLPPAKYCYISFKLKFASIHLLSGNANFIFQPLRSSYCPSLLSFLHFGSFSSLPIFSRLLQPSLFEPPRQQTPERQYSSQECQSYRLKDLNAFYLCDSPYREWEDRSASTPKSCCKSNAAHM
jgi:hypothetical protein